MRLPGTFYSEGKPIAGKRRGFVGCEKDSAWVEKSMAGVVELWAHELQNEKSDLKGGEVLMEVARVHLRGVKSRMVTHLLPATASAFRFFQWTAGASHGLQCVQTFQEQL